MLPNGIVEEVEDSVTPLRVTLHEVEVGKPVSVKVTVDPQFAVTVSDPLMVAEVEVEDGLVNVMEPVLLDQESKVQVGFVVEETVTAPGNSHRLPEGVVETALDGDAAKNYYTSPI